MFLILNTFIYRKLIYFYLDNILNISYFLPKEIFPFNSLMGNIFYSLLHTFCYLYIKRQLLHPFTQLSCFNVYTTSINRNKQIKKLKCLVLHTNSRIRDLIRICLILTFCFYFWCYAAIAFSYVS